jgi:hypothetical protein
MLLQKCRICGERHRLGPCPGVERVTVERGTLFGVRVIEEVMDPRKGNAARCKRYRENRGDAYRKRNRERMRGKRK